MGEKLVKGNKPLIALLISLLVIAAIIFINYLSFLNIENVVITQIKEKQIIETNHAANQIKQHILQVRDELVTISKFPLVDTLDINTCSGSMDIIDRSIQGKINVLLRADPSGNVIACSSELYADYLGLNIKNKDYFIKPKETNEPFISGVERQGSVSQIIISAPLFETTEYTPYPNFRGRFKGVLLSILDITELFNLYLHPIANPDKSMFLLIDAESNETMLKSASIYNFNEIKADIGDTYPLNAIKPFQNLGNSIFTSADIYFGLEKWKLIVITPVKNVGSELISIQRGNLISFGFILILIISVTVILFSLYRSREQVQSKLQQANVTLEKLGINIELEKDKYSRAEIQLEPKKIYLVKEDDENQAHELFISTLNRGFAGLGIVREDPNTLRERYNLYKTSFIWLSKNSTSIPCETDIDALYDLIAEFMSKSEKSVILIDRLDYIILQNQFDRVIRKIHELNDLLASHESIIIISIKQELIKEDQLKTIESETVDLFGSRLRNKIALSDKEMMMLKQINESNITNKLISYKDITESLGVTKPTTRAYINSLQSFGLIQIEQKGRFKALKITSAGRRMLN